MEIRTLSLAIEFPAGEAGLLELGHLVARLRTMRGVQKASAKGDKAALYLEVDAAEFSTGQLEYELGAFGVQLKYPIIRRVLLLKRLDAPETARAMAKALGAISGVLVANVDFAAGQGMVEFLASVSPDLLLRIARRFGVSAHYADAPQNWNSPSLFSDSRSPGLLALIAAIAFWTGGEAASAFSSPVYNLRAVSILFGLAALCAGWRPFCAGFRFLVYRDVERSALLVMCWFAGMALLGRWGEAAGGLIVLQAGELALAAALSRFRKQRRELPAALREQFSVSLAPLNSYNDLLTLPAIRGYFLIGTLTTAFAVAPYLLVPGLLGEAWNQWASRGLVLLPLASPESFYLAASVAVASGLRSGMENGIAFRGGAALKTLAGVKAAAYAKTGVLTQGCIVVETAIPYYGWTSADVLRVAAVLQSDPLHPIARALIEAAAPHRNDTPLTASDCIASEGGGVAGTVDDIRFFLGSRRWMQHCRVPLMRQAEEAIVSAEAQGRSVALLGVEGGLLGLITFRDTVRADAPRRVAALKELGLDTLALVSGDGANVTARTAMALGLEDTEGSFGEAERKMRAMQARQRAGGPVLAIGDGAFDAALLDGADAGFCMNGAERPNAAFFATVTAQSDDFTPITKAILLSRRMDAALLRAWGFILLVKVVALAAALLLPLPLPALVLTEAFSALLATGFLLLAVPLRLRRTETALKPAQTPKPLPAKKPPTAAPAKTFAPPKPAKNSAPSAPPEPASLAPFADAPSAESEPIEIPEPLLELVFTCDPSADEQPAAYRVYPQWESFVVPFYGEPLRFGRKYPGLSLAVQVEDEGVSRVHGEIRLDGPRPVVVDLRSSNGIRHNSKARKALIAAESPTPIKFGDTLYLGCNTRIEVRAPQ